MLSSRLVFDSAGAVGGLVISSSETAFGSNGEIPHFLNAVVIKAGVKVHSDTCLNSAGNWLFPIHRSLLISRRLCSVLESSAFIVR